MSRNHEGHVSAVKCRRIFALSSGTPSFSNFSFCPSWPVCHLREHLYMCHITPLTHSRVFATYSSTLPLLTSLMFSSSSLFALLWCVCLPLPLYVLSLATLLSFWPRAKATPQLWSSSRTGANKEATDEVRKRIKYTLTCDSQNGLKEEALSGLSLPRCR